MLKSESRDTLNVRLTVIRDSVLPFLEENFGKDHVAYRLKSRQLKSLLDNNSGLTYAELLELLYPSVAGVFDAGSRLVPDSEINGLLSVFLYHPALSSHILDNLTPGSLIDFLPETPTFRPVLVIAAHLGYPMGGGESFLFDSCVLTTELGWRNIWLSYRDPQTGWFNSMNDKETEFYLDARRIGPPTAASLVNDFNKFNPDLVHSHGAMANLLENLCLELRVPCLIGYHFWTGLVELGQTENTNIRKNIEKHRLFNLQSSAKPDAPQQCIKYVASEFMLDVLRDLGSRESFEVIHPIPNAGSFSRSKEPNDSDEPGYILLMNSHPKKGGYLLEELAKGLNPGIKIKAVVSEPGTEDFYGSLRELALHHPNLELVGFESAPSLYQSAKIVIVPSLVDETFGRVVYEAVMNNIPVFSSKAGFIEYQLGTSGVYLDEEPGTWVNTLNQYFEDDLGLERIASAQKEAILKSTSHNLVPLASAITKLLQQSPKSNVGLFTVWGDQGLGNQSREYVRQLKRLGYSSHVFSFQSYLTAGKSLRFQKSDDDWSSPTHADSVHYSLNDRENVSVHELRQFILINQIGTLLVPEICWDVNWNRLLNLNVNNLSVVGIPNIEIVRAEEVLNHNLLNGNLFPTQQCATELTERGIDNGIHLNYNYQSNFTPPEIRDQRARVAKQRRIRFLHVAGANPVTRKNTPLVIKAFIEASQFRNDIELTVTSLVPLSEFFDHELPNNVTLISDDLSRPAIELLYQSHDLSIQVSSHEGIGLGFHESIANGCPVISLDAAPHNEVVVPKTTGWLIPAYPAPMADNTSSIVSSWKFLNADLQRVIQTVTKAEISALSMLCVSLSETTSSSLTKELALKTALRETRKFTFHNNRDLDGEAASILNFTLKILSVLAQKPLAKLVPGQIKLSIYFFLRRQIQRKSIQALF